MSLREAIYADKKILDALLAFALSRVLASALEVVQPAGLATLSAIAATLGLTALLALWRPSRPALALPPVAGLRME